MHTFWNISKTMFSSSKYSLQIISWSDIKFSLKLKHLHAHMCVHVRVTEWVTVWLISSSELTLNWLMGLILLVSYWRDIIRTNSGEERRGEARETPIKTETTRSKMEVKIWNLNVLNLNFVLTSKCRKVTNWNSIQIQLNWNYFLTKTTGGWMSPLGLYIQ